MVVLGAAEHCLDRNIISDVTLDNNMALPDCVPLAMHRLLTISGLPSTSRSREHTPNPEWPLSMPVLLAK